MPVNSGRLVVRRALALAALAAALIACFWLVLRSGEGGYDVKVVLDDAGQLATGNEVQVGGVAVGSIDSVELRESDHRAEIAVELEDDVAPLHEGTTAVVRNPSLTNVAGRYLSLQPGPNDGEEIPDGGEIESELTTEIVDLDQLLNSLDPETVADLSQVIQGSTEAAKGRGKALGEAIESLNPALSRTAVTLGELTRDQRALERLLVGTSEVVETLAARRDDISSATTNTATALSAVAGEREALARSLSGAPEALRSAVPALAETRGLLEDLEPAIPEARPVARSISGLLPELRPASVRLRGILPSARRILRAPGADNDLNELLRRAPEFGGHAVPLLGDLTSATAESRPILSEVRPYIPELTSGIMAGFGGSSGGYYDANGHYARIAFLGGPFSLVGLGPLIPGTGSLTQDAVARCPGGATYRATDGSNPFVDTAVCDPSLTGNGP